MKIAKKTFLLAIVFVVITLFCSCSLYPFRVDGVYESEDSRLIVDFTIEHTLQRGGSLGQFVNEEGVCVEIALIAMHGRFSIYEYIDDTEFYGELLFLGDYRPKGETLILYFDDGTEIVLHKTDYESLPDIK